MALNVPHSMKSSSRFKGPTGSPFFRLRLPGGVASSKMSRPGVVVPPTGSRKTPKSRVSCRLCPDPVYKTCGQRSCGVNGQGVRTSDNACRSTHIAGIEFPRGAGRLPERHTCDPGSGDAGLLDLPGEASMSLLFARIEPGAEPEVLRMSRWKLSRTSRPAISSGAPGEL